MGAVGRRGVSVGGQFVPKVAMSGPAAWSTLGVCVIVVMSPEFALWLRLAALVGLFVVGGWLVFDGMIRAGFRRGGGEK